MANSERVEKWNRLLSAARLFRVTPPENGEGRSEFERDHDRVVFSSAFRRLKDKTQVFPLSPTDYTRTRLTHSLEASCVGRSLGNQAMEVLGKLNLVQSGTDIATLVATACLAHDIGNPPFGHSGESAISRWAKRLPGSVGISTEERRDLEQFEGNAQGFRILSRLLNRLQRGGLQPTIALLGAVTKYPLSSSPVRPANDKQASEKKYGFFQDDAEAALYAFKQLGLVERAAGMFARHPLAFLTEAADDICYVVMDLEDAFKLKILRYEEAKGWLIRLSKDPKPPRDDFPHSSELARLRASAVHSMTRACGRVFGEQIEAIESGSFDMPLIAATEFAEAHKALKDFERQNVYSDERVLQIEYAGYKTIGGLLDMFAEASVAESPSAEQKKLLSLLPEDSFDRPGFEKLKREDRRKALTPYQRMLAATDFVSGMTDSYAVELYQRLSGIKLPD